MPVSILLSTPAPERHLFTTNVCRFYAEEQTFLINRIPFCEHSIVIDGYRIAKFGKGIEASIYRKVGSFRSFLGILASKERKRTLYYQEACRYWAKAADRRPFFKKKRGNIGPFTLEKYPHGFEGDSSLCDMHSQLVPFLLVLFGVFRL